MEVKTDIHNKHKKHFRPQLGIMHHVINQFEILAKILKRMLSCEEFAIPHLRTL